MPPPPQSIELGSTFPTWSGQDPLDIAYYPFAARLGVRAVLLQDDDGSWQYGCEYSVHDHQHCTFQATFTPDKHRDLFVLSSLGKKHNCGRTRSSAPARAERREMKHRADELVAHARTAMRGRARVLLRLKRGRDEGAPTVTQKMQIIRDLVPVFGEHEAKQTERREMEYLGAGFPLCLPCCFSCLTSPLKRFLPQPHGVLAQPPTPPPSPPHSNHSRARTPSPPPRRAPTPPARPPVQQHPYPSPIAPDRTLTLYNDVAQLTPSRPAPAPAANVQLLPFPGSQSWPSFSSFVTALDRHAVAKSLSLRPVGTSTADEESWACSAPGCSWTIRMRRDGATGRCALSAAESTLVHDHSREQEVEAERELQRLVREEAARKESSSRTDALREDIRCSTPPPARTEGNDAPRTPPRLPRKRFSAPSPAAPLLKKLKQAASQDSDGDDDMAEEVGLSLSALAGPPSAPAHSASSSSTSYIPPRAPLAPIMAIAQPFPTPHTPPPAPSATLGDWLVSLTPRFERKIREVFIPVFSHLGLDTLDEVEAYTAVEAPETGVKELVVLLRAEMEKQHAGKYGAVMQKLEEGLYGYVRGEGAGRVVC